MGADAGGAVALSLEVVPVEGWDFGAGSGVTVNVMVRGGPAGLILDGRGRKLPWPQSELTRRELVRGWLTTLGAVPSEEAS